MPVLNKKEYHNLRDELLNRIDNLRSTFEPRELSSAREGIKGRGSWAKPDKMCATTGSSLELRVAIDDFKTILAEIKRLK